MFEWGKSYTCTLSIDEHAPLVLNKNETVLNGALRHGFDFPHSCKVGGCAACKCQLVSGKVRELTDKSYLPPKEDVLSNHILACQSVPLKDVHIALPKKSLDRQHTQGVLTQQTWLTQHIAEVHFLLDTPISYSPGQHVSIKALRTDGPDILARCYSFAHAAPAGGGTQHLSYFVRQVPQGQMPNWLLTPISLKQRVGIHASLGDFHLRGSSSAMICVAGGSGLAPLMALLEGSVQIGASNRPVSLLMEHASNPTSTTKRKLVP